jgi:protein-S-isoprenylcysteine O-methyltransferase Ste14
MRNFLRNAKGLNLVGQGGKIILFTLPALAAAVWIHRGFPGAARLPDGLRFIRPAGVLLLAAGITLWGAAIVQLLRGFVGGRLVTTGAYGIVRNPIYSSAVFFILPAVSLLTWSWTYFAVSAVLYAGVVIFIRAEERQLARAFGAGYEEYRRRVDRLIPWTKP